MLINGIDKELQSNIFGRFPVDKSQQTFACSKWGIETQEKFINDGINFVLVSLMLTSKMCHTFF